ncbi:hypothetical protein DIU31_015775 [Mucilaginibacter rubeus]|uniref:Uncharacterized protein n=1 Tax=Mucilaginibacter rubeus TaxID=2027860 RepID=A0AAE6JGD0_9SPHI|nr:MULTISPECIES: hypothetical protein [Mucilaginibacter]QEM04898.1 hypothetical protein DIU31_015775 [Mucilaginibacter rubeus]QEM17492.1 hypothetical protein DIU38_015940 [Mucilaginibacter gossypii]QTE45987.1 hypothetical protein J3L19_11740 [Mucilaginibacter rubeus]QTE52584.1 hypothetical protein J3L21_11710 [Mucilaginibacter rubeus]QTE57673.1 hypothetical protein J3L23_03385 [Mucilaginibacter rubeus]
MTFNDIVDQLKNNVATAKEKLTVAQDPFNEYAEKPYFQIMAQFWAQRSLDKAEDDLEFFVGFLNEHQFDLKTETGGIEALILNLDRNISQQ